MSDETSNAEASVKLEQIALAIRTYHLALDRREHGGVAQSRAFDTIRDIMGMHWEQGKELDLIERPWAVPDFTGVRTSAAERLVNILTSLNSNYGMMAGAVESISELEPQAIAPFVPDLANCAARVSDSGMRYHIVQAIGSAPPAEALWGLKRVQETEVSEQSREILKEAIEFLQMQLTSKTSAAPLPSPAIE